MGILSYVYEGVVALEYSLLAALVPGLYEVFWTPIATPE